MQQRAIKQHYKSLMQLLSLFGVLNERDYECINFRYSVEQAGQKRNPARVRRLGNCFHTDWRPSP